MDRPIEAIEVTVHAIGARVSLVMWPLAILGIAIAVAACGNASGY